MTSFDPKLAISLADALTVLASVRNQPAQLHTLHVKIFSPGSVGGSPCVAVTGIHAGFDWNAGKLLIETSQPLTALTPEDVAAIHKSAKEGQSWHAYQTFKKQADAIKDRDTEISELKATISDQMTPENWTELHRLREEVKSPDGFLTWKDAAVAEKLKGNDLAAKIEALNVLLADLMPLAKFGAMTLKNAFPTELRTIQGVRPTAIFNMAIDAGVLDGNTISPNNQATMARLLDTSIQSA